MRADVPAGAGKSGTHGGPERIALSRASSDRLDYYGAARLAPQQMLPVSVIRVI